MLSHQERKKSSEAIYEDIQIKQRSSTDLWLGDFVKLTERNLGLDWRFISVIKLIYLPTTPTPTFKKMKLLSSGGESTPKLNYLALIKAGQVYFVYN